MAGAKMSERMLPKFRQGLAADEKELAKIHTQENETHPDVVEKVSAYEQKQSIENNPFIAEPKVVVKNTPSEEGAKHFESVDLGELNDKNAKIDFSEEFPDLLKAKIKL